MIDTGFVREAHAGILIADSSIEALLDRMAAQQPHTPVFAMSANQL